MEALGFRQTVFTPDRGFFLNGKHVKLHGVCLHHDLGALGAAFHEKAAERQLRKMMAMDMNAIRTSHNPPARRLLDYSLGQFLWSGIDYIGEPTPYQTRTVCTGTASKKIRTRSGTSTIT